MAHSLWLGGRGRTPAVITGTKERGAIADIEGVRFHLRQSSMKKVSQMFNSAEDRSFFFALVAIYAASAVIAEVSVSLAGVAL
jgi:hypothetical protein